MRKIKVVTSLFPLYDFAKNIGGDRVELSLLLPPGVEPHEFEPSTGDLLKVGKADIFIYAGNIMEPWVAGVVKGVANPSLEVVDASRGVSLMNTPSGADPHFWLDFGNDRVIVDTILAALIKKDAEHKEYYERNAELYKAKLAALDRTYREALGSCKQKVFIEGGHHTFGYLAARYGLSFYSAAGISPNAEPRPRDLVELSRKMKQYGLKYVYFEELVDPKVARTIAAETGAKLLKLNGAHNLTRDEFRQGVSFLSLMEENLRNLKTGLECGN